MQLYQLLSDRFPFWDMNVQQMAQLGARDVQEGIMHGVVLFPTEPWSNIHPGVQDLICAMLNRDPSQRITAEAALQHPWFKLTLQQDDVQ